MNRRIVAIAAVLAALPLACAAETYRCIAKDGKRYYGSLIPAECQGRPVEQLSTQGVVVKRIDPEGAEKERLAKEAAEARRRQEDSTAREAARRNQALLATYTSEKDIDDARARAMAENTKSVQLVEGRIESIRQQQAGYEKDAAQYKGKGDLPASLQQDLKTAEADLKAQQELLEIKKRESEAINARYDDDKKRYSAITRQR
ncbi:MAG TPA: hypothetical protein VGP97_01535 [Burkholderiales bacterium]|jgi:hypothetical protein|nr:hypothetical protein [Burkholderiales bacterium]